MKRKEKELKKKFRQLAQFEYEANARLSFLMVKEWEHDRKMRTKALKMARKRKTDYIQ